MGQYYRPILIDGKKTVIFDNFFIEDGKRQFQGMKLTEHSWVGNWWVDNIVEHLKDKPAKMAWVGDYAFDDYEEHDILPEGMIDPWAEDAASKPKTKVETVVITKKENVIGTPLLAGQYIIDQTLKEYVNFDTYFKSNATKDRYGTWCLHPVPLLTAVGNGKGGGDYYGKDKEMIGRWAWHTITISKQMPGEDYKEINPNFME